MTQIHTRHIGIVHRTKKTIAGDARPTMVAIIEGNTTRVIELEDEQAELDFVTGIFPRTYRAVLPTDNLKSFHLHQVKWKELKPNESLDAHPAHLIRKSTKGTRAKPVYVVAVKVPNTFDGLRRGDMVAMPLGGSGDNLAYALVNQGVKIGATLHRVPFFALQDHRASLSVSTDDNTDDVNDDSDLPAQPTRTSTSRATAKDHLLLATLLRTRPDLFYDVRPRDMALIRVRSLSRLLSDAMKARIGCEARLRKRYEGEIFTASDGIFPEGGLEKAYAARKASDAILLNLMKEEAAIHKELENALDDLDVYRKLFQPITGVGPRIAARIIAAVSDIRRFKTAPKFCAFLGVHVLSDGTFPRRTVGKLANWSTEGRHALYLVADQFNRRPNSEWGQKFLSVKAELRKKHPEKVKSPQKLVRVYRAIERFFLQHKLNVPLGVTIAPKVEGELATIYLTSFDQLIEYFERGVSELQEKDAQNELDISNVELEAHITRFRELLEKAESGWKSPAVSVYSAGHIHKMATWRTLNLFARDLHDKWWDLEKGKAQTRRNTHKQQNAA